MSQLSEAVSTRLRTERIAWCTTLRPDGSPHLTPVWFVFSVDTWWVCSAARNKKVRNVAADPRVALALEGGDAPVVGEGLAVIHTGGFPPEVVAGFTDKYGWDITAVGPEGDRVLLQVTVSRWLLSGTAS